MEDFTRIPVPASRRFVVDAAAVALRRPIIHGLFEADVTEARVALRTAADGAPLSLTAYVVWCLGRTLVRHPRMHGYLHRGDLVVFDRVDATVIVETDEGGFSFPRAHVLRDIGGRGLLDIHREIRSLQATTHSDTAQRVRSIRGLLLLPAVVRRLIYRIYLRDPVRRRRMMGTVAVTSIGMNAERGFWGIALPQHTLQLVVGGIAAKPRFVDGHVVERELLSMTLAVDHDVVDGAPAVRFADDLITTLEDLEGLRRHLDSDAGEVTRP